MTQEDHRFQSFPEHEDIKDTKEHDGGEEEQLLNQEEVEAVQEDDIAEQKVEADRSELQQKIAELEQENKDLANRLLRLQADFDNYRKRVKAEKDELIQYANFNLVQKLLPVIDNLDRATSASEQGSEGILEGLEMIRRHFMDILQKEGVTPIECEGKPFDPNCHDAVMTEEGSDYPPDTVVEELQKGYKMNDKILRASMVKVSI